MKIGSYKLWLSIGALVVIAVGVATNYFGISVNNDGLTTLISAGISLAVVAGLITKDPPQDGNETTIKDDLQQAIDSAKGMQKSID